MKAVVVVGLIGFTVLISGIRELIATRSERHFSTGGAAVHSTSRGGGYVVAGLALLGVAGLLLLNRRDDHRASAFSASSEPPEPDPSEPLSPEEPPQGFAAAPAGPGDHACPGCKSRMAEVPAAGVTLALCQACGGTWLDGDALEVIGGAGARPGPLEGHTERRCATCRLTLSCALWGSIPVERCSACGGVYLDHGELEELAPGLDLPLRPVTSNTAPPVRSGFECVKCGAHAPLAEGNATASGLMCRVCVPVAGLTVLERQEANLGYTQPWYGPGLGGTRGASLVVDLAVDTWRTLRSGRDADRKQ